MADTIWHLLAYVPEAIIGSLRWLQESRYIPELLEWQTYLLAILSAPMVMGVSAWICGLAQACSAESQLCRIVKTAAQTVLFYCSAFSITIIPTLTIHGIAQFHIDHGNPIASADCVIYTLLATVALLITSVIYGAPATRILEGAVEPEPAREQRGICRTHAQAMQDYSRGGIPGRRSMS